MQKFIIKRGLFEENDADNVISLKKESYDKIVALSEKTGKSFEKIFTEMLAVEINSRIRELSEK